MGDAHKRSKYGLLLMLQTEDSKVCFFCEKSDHMSKQCNQMFVPGKKLKKKKEDALCVLERNMLPRILARKAFLVKIVTDVTTEHFAPMKEIN